MGTRRTVGKGLLSQRMRGGDEELQCVCSEKGTWLVTQGLQKGMGSELGKLGETEPEGHS